MANDSETGGGKLEGPKEGFGQSPGTESPRRAPGPRQAGAERKDQQAGPGPHRQGPPEGPEGPGPGRQKPPEEPEGPEPALPAKFFGGIFARVFRLGNRIREWRPSERSVRIFRMVVFGHGLEEQFYESWEDVKIWLAGAARSLSSWCRDNPFVFPLLLLPFLLLYLAVLYKIIQIAAFMITVGSLKEAVRWSDLPFFRYEPIPLALAGALGLLHLLGSVRAVRRLRLEGPRPLLDEIGAKRLGRAYELTGAAGRRRQEFWIYTSEWLAAAARIAPPDLYIMPEEKAINLMAMGLTPETSVICVTYASLAQLTDPEVEAVLAYAVARIQNGSAAFETRWSAVLYGLMSLSLIGRRIARREEGWLWVPWLFELAMRGLGLIGSIAARWFQAFLCLGEASESDAAAIELMGAMAAMRFRAKSKSRPESAILREERRKGIEAGQKALAQALKTILGWYLLGRIRTKMALAIAPLFFVSPDLPAFSLRHPKLLGRILDLDPDFSGNPDKVFPVPDSMMGGREM